jgi:hypothetical protein
MADVSIPATGPFQVSDLKAAFGLPGSTSFSCSELVVEKIGDYGQGTNSINLSTFRGKMILDLAFAVTATVNDGTKTNSTPASVGHNLSSTYTVTTNRIVDVNTVVFSYSSVGKGYTVEALSLSNTDTTLNNLQFSYNSSTDKYAVNSTKTLGGTVLPSITYTKRNGVRKTVNAPSLDATSVSSTVSFKPVISITTTPQTRTESVTTSTTVTRYRSVPVYESRAQYTQRWVSRMVWQLGYAYVDVWTCLEFDFDDYEAWCVRYGWASIYMRQDYQVDNGYYEDVFTGYAQVLVRTDQEAYTETVSSTSDVTRSFMTSSASVSIPDNPDTANIRVSDFSVYVASGSASSTNGSTTVVYKLRWTPLWTGVQLSDSGSGASASLSFS